MSSLDKDSLDLLERLRASHPDIVFFLSNCSQVAPADMVTFLKSREVEVRLSTFGHTSLIMLHEVLRSIRENMEIRNRYLEAASWDLLSDRVADELSKRSGTPESLWSAN